MTRLTEIKLCEYERLASLNPNGVVSACKFLAMCTEVRALQAELAAHVEVVRLAKELSAIEAENVPDMLSHDGTLSPSEQWGRYTHRLVMAREYLYAAVRKLTEPTDA